VIALAPLRIPLLALGIGLGGVGLAWLWFDGQELVAAAAVVVALGVGIAFDWAGQHQLPDSPVLARQLMEVSVLVPIALATAASAAVVIVTVELTLPDKTPTETVELVGAVSTGVTTFLTAGFIAWSGDAKDSTMADHIKQAFQGKYKPDDQGVSKFPRESPGEQWVFAEHYRDASGWGHAARVKRARGVAEALKSSAAT
jgi:hypothetical protein